VIFTPLASPSPAAIRDALVRRGVSVVQAEATATGLTPAAAILEGLSHTEREQVMRAAATQGVACVTGDGWALLAGELAQLGGLARASTAGFPREAAVELGRLVQGGVGTPAWEMGRGTLTLERPGLVGILNLTPDSFSDGGRYQDPGRALAHAETLLEEGAHVLDLGAESTRPGVEQPVSEEEEWRRLEPVLTDLIRRFPSVPVSVDTVKAAIARRALEAGAWAINDVSALRLDPALADACAAHGAGLVLMHSRGPVRTMATYHDATYQDVVAEVVRELSAAIQVAEERGVPRVRMVLDPGLGFSKTPEQSYQALRGVGALAGLGHPVMVGPSRKRFLGAVTGRDVAERDVATAAACALGWVLGARLFRVHAIGPTRDALAVAFAAQVR
jgi:dihydropteroate synthase